MVSVERMMVAKFLRNEQGGYTIWGLTWFMIYLAIGGLAVDVTDAYRNQTLLQSTADSSAIAGAMQLPNQADAATAATTYAEDNLSQTGHGTVLTSGDVSTGVWDYTTRTFTPGAANPNAVRVITRRAAQNNNALEMNLLRILSLVGIDPAWNIDAEAIATAYIPGCIRDGLIALNQVALRSNNTHLNGICVHGQNAGIDMQNHNYFEPGVLVSMPDLSMLPNRANLYSMNPGLEEALRQGDMYPRDIARLGAIITGLINMDPDYLPDYMVDIDASTGARSTKAGVTKVTDNSLPPVLAPNTVYDISCGGQLKLPKNLMLRVVVIADCRIQSSSGTNIIDGVIASTYTGNNAAIQLAAQTLLGLPDNCAPGGGVELYTLGEAHVAAQGGFHGVRIVAASDVKFTSNNNGIYGMSIQSGNNIDYSSNNSFGGCTGGVPGQVAMHYRLVH